MLVCTTFISISQQKFSIFSVSCYSSCIECVMTKRIRKTTGMEDSSSVHWPLLLIARFLRSGITFIESQDLNEQRISSVINLSFKIHDSLIILQSQAAKTVFQVRKTRSP